MNKMKILLATVCCLFVIGSVSAQKGVDNLTVVWDGAPGYRPNTTFTIKATKNGVVYSNVFYGSGIWAPPMVIGSNTIGAIEGRVEDGGTGYSSFSTTYPNYYNNSMMIGQEYSHYIDTWNGKNWYLYSSKVTATEWHWRIGN